MSTTMSRSTKTDMRRIKFGVTGLIRAGRWAGQTIRIDDDSGETGGYYIHIGPDASGAQAGDIWVESHALDAYFDRARWEVDWPKDE